MKFFACILILNISILAGYAQNNVGIGTSMPDSSAVLHLESTTMGFLPPRMTSSERDAITNPASGLVIFNTTDSVLQYFNGTCWMHSYQENCDDCFFNMSLSPSSGVIDRINSDTAGTDVFITQTGGPQQTIALFLFHNLPQGTTASMSVDTVNGSGTSHLTVTASIFSAPGTYPVAVQAICGSAIKIKIFIVTIDSCITVTLSGSYTDYDLQAVNGLPGPGTKICVVVNVLAGAEINSSDTIIASYTSGNLDPASHVGINNNGAFLARGGDGGVGGVANGGNPGFGGGNAINLTCKTTLLNNGYIFGGGGGGGSVGYGDTLTVPVIGSFVLAIGAGGGGGAALGAGGITVVPIPYFSPGNDATGGINGTGGAGGILNVPISIPIPPVTIIITPNIYGGNGGGYGQNGAAGTLTISVAAQVPVLGLVPITTVPTTAFPPGGLAGYAIKRNGNQLVSFTDGNYQTNYIKGIIGQ